MAIIFDSNQYKYSKRGPLDAKALVKTYAELLDQNTWLVNDFMAAYNGMITAVWLNKDDISKNGIYFLFDPNATSAVKVPDVANEANWHKIAEVADIADFTARLSTIETNLQDLDTRLTTLEDESDVITYGYRSGFPAEGEDGKLYVAADEKKSYVWFNGEYLLVSRSDSSYEEPEIIYGGSAD
jgi:hypothetical protein